MKLSLEKIACECDRRDLTLGALLREAGVSRNAYYSLARKDYVVPASLVRIAERLEVPVAALVDETETPGRRMRSLAVESERILRRCPGSDPDNVRHTLILLDERPVERLRRALRRGRFVDLR